MWLLFLILLGGGLATYLCDEDAPLSARLAMGVPVGMTVYGLVVYAVAHGLGLTPWTLGVALLICAGCLGAGLRGRWSKVRADVERVRLPRRWGPVVYFALVSAILWAFFRRVVWETPNGIYTTIWDNYADMAYHIGFIESFAQGDNFPPTHPMYAGVRLTYPFLADFFAAVLMAAGLTRTDAIFWQNFALGMAMVGLLYRLTLCLTRNRSAAAIAPLLVIFGGGLGFVLLLPEARENGVTGLNTLFQLPHDFTEWNNVLWWGNPLVYWFATMRGMLLAAPMMLLIWGLFWRAFTRHEYRLLTTAGVLTALLALVHTHTFLCTVTMGFLISLLFRRWRDGSRFAIIAVLLGLPSLLVLFSGSATRTGTFTGICLGWMAPESDEKNALVFWLMNAGLFVPILLLALVWRHRGRFLLPRNLRRFYLPFLLCFIAPNIVKFAPWAWDNVKVLYVWFFASAPIVALFIARLLRSRTPGGQSIGLTLLALLILSGGLDVWRVVSRSDELEIFTKDDLTRAAQIVRRTPPRAVILSAPVHNSAVMLSGRRMFMTYPGFLWTNGLPYEEREQEIAFLLSGQWGTGERLRKHGIQYVLIGPKEREYAKERQFTLNESYFAQFPRVDNGSLPDSRLYRVP
jgi:hypothetical protein